MKYFKFLLNAFDGEQVEQNTTAAGVAPEEPTADNSQNAADKEKAFDELIKGEYKEQYDARFKDGLNRRFKAQKDSEAELGRYTNLTDLLAQKYKTSDPDELYKMIDGDDSFYEDMAYEANTDVETFRKMQSLTRENEKYKKQQAQIEEQANIDAIYEEWVNETEELKQFYPNIDLEVECENQRFVSLLENGCTVGEAYRTVHFDEIMQSMLNEAAKNAKQETTANIVSRSARPMENGTRNTAGTQLKIDPSKMTKADFDNIYEQLKRGGKFYL